MRLGGGTIGAAAPARVPDRRGPTSTHRLSTKQRVMSEETPIVERRSAPRTSRPTQAARVDGALGEDGGDWATPLVEDAVDWRIENSAKNWATAYDFLAVTDKRVILEEFPIKNIGMMQAFAFNLRREKFQDPRVRLAFNYAFDFEEMNKQIFFGQYKRIASYFEGTDLAATGLPAGRELELLEAVRIKVPADLCSKKPYANPVGGNPCGGARRICARQC